MPRTSRVRTIVPPKRPNGHIDEYYFYHQQWPITASWWDRPQMRYCNDLVGDPYIDGDFSLAIWNIPEARFSSSAAGPYNSWLRNCPGPLPNELGKLETDHGVPNWDMLAAQAMANANPNKPWVDLPLFLWELKDLPQLIKSSRNIYKTVTSPSTSPLLPTIGEANLAYNFGLKPMVDDLLKLVGFAKAMEKQINYLKRLEKGTKLQRTLGTESGTETLAHYPSAWHCPSISGRGQYVRTEQLVTYEWQRDAWYTMRVKLLEPLPILEEGEFDWLSAQVVLGLYANWDTAWNAVPFSWLIDWFSNFGDIISTTRGRVKFTWRDLNIMSHFKANSTLDYVKGVGVDGPSTSHISYELKMRHVRPTPYALPAFELPLLSKYQLGILSSLAITRGRSGR